MSEYFEYLTELRDGGTMKYDVGADHATSRF